MVIGRQSRHTLRRKRTRVERWSKGVGKIRVGISFVATSFVALAEPRLCMGISGYAALLIHDFLFPSYRSGQEVFAFAVFLMVMCGQVYLLLVGNRFIQRGHAHPQPSGDARNMRSHDSSI